MKHRRLNIASSIAALVASTAFILPGIAAAESYQHPANNEAGVKTYPEDFNSQKTREQVKAEAGTAAREGGSNRFNTGAYPASSKQANAGKTRQEVINELLKETPEQRDARQRAMGG